MKNDIFKSETQSISRILIVRMHDIMPQDCGNLTGFRELYSNGHLILKIFSSFFSPTSFLKQFRTPKKL